MFLLPIELRQAAPKSGVPTVNALLIAANVLIYLLGWSWAVGYGTGLASILLYGFSHFGLWHLILNLWGLWVFGNPVNRRLGNGYYLLAYLGAVLTVGLISRVCCPGPAMGASGAIYAVMTIAMILMPAARLEVVYLIFFPITVLVGLVVPPRRYWLHWFIRWGAVELRMYWCLVLIPVMLVAQLILFGLYFGVWIWSWGTTAHLLGMICGAAIVLILPARITMPGRVARNVV
jgi:membrane associated rhomboid family serine protease